MASPVPYSFVFPFFFCRIDKLATPLGANAKSEIYDFVALTLSCNKLILSNEVAKVAARKQEESISALENHVQTLIRGSMAASESAYKAECKRVDELRAANKGAEHTVKSPRKKFIWNETIM